MLKSLETIREMLYHELNAIAEDGEITAGNLITIDTLTHAIKNLDCIIDRYHDNTGDERHRSNQDVIIKLGDMMGEVHTEAEREALRECIEAMR